MTETVEPMDDYGDALTVPFWKAAAEHKLIVQRCDRCDHRQFYPRPMCVACGELDVSWVELTGEGTIHSLTIVRRQLLDEFEPPYTVVLVDLDDGPRFLAGLLEPDRPAAIGDRVAIAWMERADKPPLPMFRLAPA